MLDELKDLVEKGLFTAVSELPNLEVLGQTSDMSVYLLERNKRDHEKTHGFRNSSSPPNS